MRALGLFRRGMRDTYEHFLPFSAATLGWWAVMALPVALAAVLGWIGFLLFLAVPGATASLFAFTDPRRTIDRPGIAELAAAFRRSLRPGLAVATITVPVIALLGWNIAYYGDSRSRFAVLVPLWSVLFLMAVAVALAAFALTGLFNLGAMAAVKRAFVLTGSAPLRSFMILVILGLITGLGALLVIPLLLVVPAMITATMNRFVLDRLGIVVVDPLMPTDERLHEQQARRAAKV